MHCRLRAPLLHLAGDGEPLPRKKDSPVFRVGGCVLPTPLLSTAQPATLSHPRLFFRHSPAHSPSLSPPLPGPAPPSRLFLPPDLGSSVQTTLPYSQRQLPGYLRPIPAFIGCPVHCSSRMRSADSRPRSPALPSPYRTAWVLKGKRRGVVPE